MEIESVCCDIVKRLSNDVNAFIFEINTMLQLQKCYENLKNQFEDLHNQVDGRLTEVYFDKLQFSIENGDFTINKIEEFVYFIKNVWKTLSDQLEAVFETHEYTSTSRGVALVPLLNELMDFIFHCTRTFYPHFKHTHCINEFNNLTHQLNYIVYPEVEQADSFARSLSYTKAAVPCLINLLTIIDLYSYCPRYDGLLSLCYDVIYNGPPQESVQQPLLPTRFLQTLNSGELLMPLPSILIPMDSNLSQLCQKMVNFLWEMSMVEPHRPSVPQAEVYPAHAGILQSPYRVVVGIQQSRLYNFRPVGDPDKAGVGKTTPPPPVDNRPQLRLLRKRRGGPKTSTDDLVPIKLSKLQLQTLD